MGRVHLCRVAGNTVWSHVASDVPQLWDGVPVKSYIGLYLFFHLLEIIYIYSYVRWCREIFCPWRERLVCEIFGLQRQTCCLATASRDPRHPWDAIERHVQMSWDSDASPWPDCPYCDWTVETWTVMEIKLEPCYRREDHAMPLYVSIRIKFYNGIVRFLCHSTHFLLVFVCRLQWIICQKVTSTRKNHAVRSLS